VAEQAASLADKLATGTGTHDYGITADAAKALGLPVSTDMPEEVYEFMSLFAQPTRTRPSVEYVPAATSLPRSGRPAAAEPGRAVEPGTHSGPSRSIQNGSGAAAIASSSRRVYEPRLRKSRSV
jgi:ClpP class serine protease